MLEYNGSSFFSGIFVLHKFKYSILASLLGREKALAVDLEAHSIRSFQGFVCLMQVSTWRHDFLIDTILLRNKVNKAKINLGLNYDFFILNNLRQYRETFSLI